MDLDAQGLGPAGWVMQLRSGNSTRRLLWTFTDLGVDTTHAFTYFKYLPT